MTGCTPLKLPGSCWARRIWPPDEQEAAVRSLLQPLQQQMDEQLAQSAGKALSRCFEAPSAQTCVLPQRPFNTGMSCMNSMSSSVAA